MYFTFLYYLVCFCFDDNLFVWFFEVNKFDQLVKLICKSVYGYGNTPFIQTYY